MLEVEMNNGMIVNLELACIYNVACSANIDYVLVLNSDV